MELFYGLLELFSYTLALSYKVANNTWIVNWYDNSRLTIKWRSTRLIIRFCVKPPRSWEFHLWMGFNPFFMGRMMVSANYTQRDCRVKNWVNHNGSILHFVSPDHLLLCYVKHMSTSVCKGCKLLLNADDSAMSFRTNNGTSVTIDWLNEWCLTSSGKYYMHIQDKSILMNDDDEWTLIINRPTGWAGFLTC